MLITVVILPAIAQKSATLTRQIVFFRFSRGCSLIKILSNTVFLSVMVIDTPEFRTAKIVGAVTNFQKSQQGPINPNAMSDALETTQNFVEGSGE